ncbi:hypothetical protein BJV77DRAFT_997784 [Russula vinacea]|nr:hypothetical protein BJV77DRAFT_997784 [Russula vinacea]
MPENNSLAEQGQHGPTSLDISESNTQDDSEQKRPIPLGVPLTGNILFTISWILGLGIPKAVYSYRGQSLISPTLDWVAGIIFTLISLCLGQIESKRPELCPRFFEVDLAPCILKFLRRDGGECCGELAKGTDCISRTVLVWFTSALPLLLVVESILSSVVYTQWDHFKKVVSVNNVTAGGYDSTWLFTSAWAEKVGPTWTVNMTRLELADKEDPPVQFMMTSQLYEDGYILHVLGVVKIIRTNSDDLKFAQLILTMTTRLYLWMIPWVAPPILVRRHHEGFFSSHSHSQRQIIQYLNVIWGVFMVILEVTITFAWQQPRFPETLFGSFFLCCAFIPIWKGICAIIPPTWID